MNSLPRVALVVINWNGRPFLEACLTSLLKLNYPDFSVTVVDNASTDGSPDFIRDRFSQVELRCNPHNLGYGGGANVILRACAADVAVVLNTDLIVPPDWLTHLVIPMMDDPTIGIAGCKLYHPGGRIIQHAGGYITKPQAWPGHYGLNDEDRGQLDTMRDVDYVIGAALAIKRATLEHIGLFDEGYFLYYEDADLCLRARQAGYRVVYIPDAWLTHVESATTVKGSAAYLRRFFRARWRFILKHYAPLEILGESIPAEQAWLAHCNLVERQAAADAYRATLEGLSDVWLARARDSGIHVQAMSEEEQTLIADQLQTLLVISQQAPQSPLMSEALPKMNAESTNQPSTLYPLRTKQLLQEQPFASHVPFFGPLIARLREAWNSVSTKWYVRPLLQQQNEFNELAVNQFAAQEARLQAQEVWLDDHERRFGEHVRHFDEQTIRLASLEAGLAERAALLETRARDHDAWLVAQDREQSVLVHDLAEIRLQLVQMNQLLQDLNQRVGRLSQEKDRVA
jgi:GT2 family glycosyltransferase